MVVVSTPSLGYTGQSLQWGGNPLVGSGFSLGYIDECLQTTPWLLVGFEATTDGIGPVITPIFPAPLSTGNNEFDQTIFNVDGTQGIDLVTLQVAISGDSAIIGGAFQPGYNGFGSAIIPNGTGYDIRVAPSNPYDAFENVPVSVSIDDSEGDQSTLAWTWKVRDYLGPLVDPIDPIENQTNVTITSHVEVDVTDEQVFSFLTIEIDRGSGFEMAFELGGLPQFKPGFDNPASLLTTITGGYRVKIDPVVDFPKSTPIYVKVLSIDPAGNPARI